VTGDRPPPPRGRGGDAQPLGLLLKRYLRSAKLGPRRRQAGVLDAWTAVAAKEPAPEFAQDTRPASLNKGILTVEVRSPALLHELQGFRKDEFLGRLLEHDRTGRITGLRFRLGVF